MTSTEFWNLTLLYGRHGCVLLRSQQGRIWPKFHTTTQSADCHWPQSNPSILCCHRLRFCVYPLISGYHSAIINPNVTSALKGCMCVVTVVLEAVTSEGQPWPCSFFLMIFYLFRWPPWLLQKWLVGVTRVGPLKDAIGTLCFLPLRCTQRVYLFVISLTFPTHTYSPLTFIPI